MDVEEIEAMGTDCEGWAPIGLRQMGAMARTNASIYPHDSEEFKAWIRLSQRYERAARLADEDPRALHGFEGDDS